MSPERLCFRSSFSVSASLNTGVERDTSPTSLVSPNLRECFEGRKERIKTLIKNADLSISAYDTAWVAMVPSPHCPQAPCFPQCVNWLLENQCHDGSWSLPHHSPQLLKDVLQSTLACVLALKKWAIGDGHISKGVQFIELNIASAADKSLFSPIGFDIIFPGMLEYASNLDLNICLKSKTLSDLLHKRDLELQKNHDKLSKERQVYLAYVSEGIVNLQNSEMVMKYQQKNGSLFNSPSTTAAALTQFQNSDCCSYLNSVLRKFGNAVPTIYPLDIHAKLSMVDCLQRLGIARHFMEEMRNVMDETYRFWLQEEEEIIMIASTCALAFRLLRKNGYDVSSDPLVKFLEEDCCSDLHCGQLKDMDAILELYRASEMVIHMDETTLENFNVRTKGFLEQALSNELLDANRLTRQIRQEVDDVLKFPFSLDLERIRNKRNIEHYNQGNTRVLKTSYRLSNMGSKDIWNLAVEDYNLCLSVHREESADFERWVIHNRLDKLKFARQTSAYCYFSAAATLSSPELSVARMSWAKMSFLAAVVDDFFDVGGSIEELKNLIQLVERWDVNISIECCSEQVAILFSVLKSTICEYGDKAHAWQGRSVTKHLIELWLDCLYSMMREAEWAKDMSVPTLNEYIANGYVSFAIGPCVLLTLYFVGPKLPDEVVRHSEVQNLFRILSTCGRLLNDIHSFERESKAGQLNSVSLLLIHGNGYRTKEAAVKELRHMINIQRKELLRLVLQEKDSVVPRVCKDLFWNMSQILHLFYYKNDGFTLKEMIRTVEAIYEPISSGLSE